MMTPEELKAWRKARGLPQDTLARQMGVDRKSYQRWEWGVHPIPLWAERMLALMERVP